MIGGEKEIIQRLDPIFAALAPGIGAAPRTSGRCRSDKPGKLEGTAEQGYLHCGPHGAGHFVKMVHNGIEYGLMAAYAEGLNILHSANAGKQRARRMPKQRLCAIRNSISMSSTLRTSWKSGAAEASSHHGCSI